MWRQAQLTGEVRGAFFGSITRRMPNPPHRPRPWKPITGVSDQPLSQSNPPQRKRYQLPGAYSANRSFGYFPPPPADHDTVLYIGRDPGASTTTAIVGRDLALGAQLDGVLNPLPCAARFGRTGSSFSCEPKEY
jgi:hypothetical protein